MIERIRGIAKPFYITMTDEDGANLTTAPNFLWFLTVKKSATELDTDYLLGPIAPTSVDDTGKLMWNLPESEWLKLPIGSYILEIEQQLADGTVFDKMQDTLKITPRVKVT